MIKGPVDFDESWGNIRSGMVAILEDVAAAGITLNRWREMYSKAYAICAVPMNPKPDQLYHTVAAHLVAHVAAQFKVVEEKSSYDMLPEYLRRWSSYTTGMKLMNEILTYLNKHWIQKNCRDGTNVYPIYELALHTWRRRLFGSGTSGDEAASSSGTADTLLRHVLDLIQQDRNGEVIDRQILAGIIRTFVELGLNKNNPLATYNEDFERPFLRETKAYYSRASANFLLENNVRDYLKQVVQWIQEERGRVQAFLHPTSETPLLLELDQQLIETHKATILATVDSLVSEEREDDLKRMFFVLGRVGAHDPMCRALTAFITTVGTEALRGIDLAAKDVEPYVQALVATHLRFFSLVQRAFDSASNVVAAFNLACNKFVNTHADKAPELLARYAHVLLERGNHTLTADELETKLTNVVNIVRFLVNKDIFQKHYSRMLAKRLIQNSSVSDESEELMINKLKHLLGFDFTNKMTRMFMDKNLSGDTNTKFAQYCATQGLPVCANVEIMVLTSAAWPLQAHTSNFTMPAELAGNLSNFVKYYTDAHSGRKLSWLHHVSKGDLRAHCFSRRLELQVSTYQLGVLLLYNDRDTYRVTEIADLTGLNTQELARTLQSLLKCGIVVISNLHAPADTKALCGLTADQFSEALGPEATVVVNTSFTSKRPRVRVYAFLQPEAQEDARLKKNVEQDRTMQIQAAIMRVMKARKVLSHNELLEAVIKLVSSHFLPQIPQVKKCIEQLIERDYLDRGESGSVGSYRYLA